MDARDGARAPRLRDLAFEVLSTCRARWATLLIAGVIVFVPLGFVDVLAEDLSDSLTDDGVGEGLLAAAAVGASAAALAALAGEVIYAGVAARVVVADREGRELRFRELVAHLPVMRLLAVDLLAVVVIALGFIALLVPGIVFLAWFALVAPAVELEGRGVIAAFRRSHALVRTRFWLVLGVVMALLVVESALSAAAESASWWGLGEGFLADWGAATLASVLTSPPYGVAVTVLFLELRAGRR
jgi:hypothetical protein